MTCKECLYCWQDENDEYPRCHFNPLFDSDPAPCEYDDYVEQEPYGWEEE